MNTSQNLKTTKTQSWLLAMRPKTLPAAAAPIVVASAVALYDRVFIFWIALTALAVALLLQIGANFANDLFDYQRGADTENRLGPLRVTQAGLISPRQIKYGMAVVFGLAAILGSVLVVHAGWPLLLVGVTAILAAIAYTGGPLPYGYFGLGEFFVFLFFGFAAVCGTYYAQAGELSQLAIWSGLPMGCLSTAILVVNNLRDIPTDSEAGKRTLAVRFGPKFARAQYDLMLLVAYGTVLLLVLSRLAPFWISLAALSLVKVPQLRNLVHRKTGSALNAALAGTGQLELLFALLYSAGLSIPYLLSIN